MRRFEDIPPVKNEEVTMPSACYELAWTKNSTTVTGPVKAEKLKMPLLLRSLKPQLDTRTPEQFLPPASVKPEFKVRPLTSDDLTSYEENAKRILSWVKDAQSVLSAPTPDTTRLNKLMTECTKGPIAQAVGDLQKSSLGTYLPISMPQAMEPWEQTKESTKQVAETNASLAKVIGDPGQAAKSRQLLQAISDELTSALSDGFDRTSALSDKLPKKDILTLDENTSPEDTVKANQVKLLGAYETLSYYVSTIETQVQTLSERYFTPKEPDDKARLERSYRVLKREIEGLKQEFNASTMKRVEDNKDLTAGQRLVLRRFRQGLEEVMPALLDLDKQSPAFDKTYQPLNSDLAYKMSELQRLSWRVSGKNGEVTRELAIKQEIKTASAWKKPLLEQKLTLVQYIPLANGMLDVRNAAYALAQKAVDKYDWSSRHRQELVGAIETFQAGIDAQELLKLEEFGKCASLTPQQGELLKQFRANYQRVQPEVEAMRVGVQQGNSMDLTPIASESRAHLDELCNQRAMINSIVRSIDDEITARQLQESTPQYAKPLLIQYNSYKEFSRVSDVVDEIQRDLQDVVWLTDGFFYSKQERAIHLQEKSNDLMGRIRNFKSICANTETQQRWSAMINSKDLTAEQSIQLRGFYDHLQILKPEIDQLENDVLAGPGKNFWKSAQAIRVHLEAAHDAGFKILLSSFDLSGKLHKELEKRK